MADEVFGPYRLLSELGAGGMGEVWRALDTRKDREVAVKVLRRELGVEPDYVERFRREAALAARLNAPNIIPIHDYGEIDGRLFIEMPLINGTDLATLVAQQGPLDPGRAVGVIEQVAAALDVAHDAGLVHRDVKPSNVLVMPWRGGGDFVYLIDFGIARATSSTQTTATATGIVFGTLAYMAPERFDGVSDPRGDVYALSCVLFHALTGQDPFAPPAGIHEPALYYLRSHLYQPPPFPSAQCPAVPAAFDDVVARGMAKNPDSRFATAGALAAAADTALAAPLARGGGTTTRAVGPAGSSLPPVDVGSSRAAPLVEHQFVGHTGIVYAVTTAQLDGRPVVVSGGDDKTVRVWDLATGRQLRSMSTGAGGHVHSVATVQLDGRPVVVFGGFEWRVRVWDLATGQQLRELFTSGGDGKVYSVATALLNGQTVVFGSCEKTVRAWNLATGRPFMFRLPRRAGRVKAVAVTKVGGRTVLISGGSDSTVRVWDLAGRPVGSPFTGHTSSVSAVATAELQGRAVVVSGSDDKTVRVWDLATGQQLRSLRTGDDGHVYSVATAQLRGQTVVISGGSDGVQMWDLATGEPVGSSFTGHTAAVSAVTTAELDGRPVVISGSHDTTVRVWDLTARAHS